MGEMGRLRRPAWEAGRMLFSSMAWLGRAWGLGCRAGGWGDSGMAGGWVDARAFRGGKVQCFDLVTRHELGGQLCSRPDVCGLLGGYLLFLETIYGAVIGLMFCLTPIPLFPWLLIKAIPAFYMRYRGQREIWRFPLLLIGTLPFAAFPLLLVWLGYEKFGAHSAVALALCMYLPLWWRFKSDKKEVI